MWSQRCNSQMKATTILLCILLSACAPLRVWNADNNPNDSKLPGLPVLVPDKDDKLKRVVYVNARPGLFGSSSLTANIEQGRLTTLTVNSSPSETAVGGVVDLANAAIKPIPRNWAIGPDAADSTQQEMKAAIYADLTELGEELNALLQRIERMD